MGRALPRRDLERHGPASGALPPAATAHAPRPPSPPPLSSTSTSTITSTLTTSTLHSSQFPLDSDDILIRVGPKEYTDQDVVLEIDAKKHGTEGASGDRIKSSNLEEWELGNPSVRIERSGPTGSGNYYSNVVFCV